MNQADDRPQRSRARGLVNGQHRELDPRVNELKFVCMRSFALVSLAVFTIILPGGRAWAAEKDTASPSGCSSAEQTSSPKALISNGLVNAVVYLPDAKDGYNRGSRFDWSGMVGCLAYKGHTYFGVWFPHYDPLLHDAITGPVMADAAPVVILPGQ